MGVLFVVILSLLFCEPSISLYLDTERGYGTFLNSAFAGTTVTIISPTLVNAFSFLHSIGCLFGTKSPE